MYKKVGNEMANPNWDWKRRAEHQKAKAHESCGMKADSAILSVIKILIEKIEDLEGEVENLKSNVRNHE